MGFKYKKYIIKVEMTSEELLLLFFLLLALFLYFMIVFARRREPLPMQSNTIPVGVVEPFTEPLQEGLGIANVQNKEHPLSQYMMMGAYNATFDGQAHSLKQLKTVLDTGCRFLDLEIRVLNMMPVVVASSSGTSIQSNAYSPLSLGDVLNAITTSCFSPSSLNSTDPVFLHFRIYVTDPAASRKDFYNTMASILYNELSGLLYQGKINSGTSFANLTRSVILAADMTLIPDVGSYPATCFSGPNCISLVQMLNIVTGTTYWSKMGYDTVSGLPPLVQNDGTIAMPPASNPPNPPLLTIVVPPASTLPSATFNNPSPVDLNRFVSLSGCQTVLYMWYQKDTGNNELQFYESLFSNNGAAFVLVGRAIAWIQGNYKKQTGAQTANYPTS